MPTSSTLILPPEYSSWGYPYGEWGPGAWRGGSAPGEGAWRGGSADLAVSPQRPRRPMSRAVVVWTLA